MSDNSHMKQTTTGEVHVMQDSVSVQLDHGLVVPFVDSQWMLADEQYVVCWLDDPVGHQPKALRIYTSLYPSGGRCVSIAADGTGRMTRIV